MEQGGCLHGPASAGRKQGEKVLLIEGTDMLLGTDLVGEGEILELIDQNSLDRDIEFPEHPQASLSNVATVGPVVKGTSWQKVLKYISKPASTMWK